MMSIRLASHNNQFKFVCNDMIFSYFSCTEKNKNLMFQQSYMYNILRCFYYIPQLFIDNVQHLVRKNMDNLHQIHIPHIFKSTYKFFKSGI